MTSSTEDPPFAIEDPDTTVDPFPPIEEEPTTEMSTHEASAALALAGSAFSAPTHAGPTRSGAALAALIEQGHPLVEPVARRLAREVAFHADFDELTSVGRAALVEAATIHDPERAPFAPWVMHRLRWAMIDHLRREPNHRAARRANALAAAELAGREALRADPDAEGKEGAPVTTSPRARLAAALAARAAGLAVGLAIGSAVGVDAVPDSSQDPERAVFERRQAERLREAVATLPDRQRALVTRHYFGGERFDHIADSLGLSKSWASRLHAQAIAELGRVMREE